MESQEKIFSCFKQNMLIISFLDNFKGNVSFKIIKKYPEQETELERKEPYGFPYDNNNFLVTDIDFCHFIVYTTIIHSGKTPFYQETFKVYKEELRK